jgi:hypothetical protein
MSQFYVNEKKKKISKAAVSKKAWSEIQPWNRLL